MKKTCLFISALLVVLASVAQTSTSVIKLTVNKQYGETIDLWPTPQSKEDVIRIDWGDGELKEYTVDPNGIPFYKKVSGTFQGAGEADTVRIYAQLLSLDCSSGNVTSVILENQPLLEQLDAYDNEITSDGYGTYFAGAPNLKRLNLQNNQLVLLDVRSLTKLEMLSVYDNPKLTTVFFAPEGESFESITSISMSGCDISHFYPVNMPNLSSLSIGNGSLMDLELGEYYPSLSSLDISNNYISTIDVTNCPNLSQLNVSGNLLTELNITQNSQLVGLSCTNNQIKKLNLRNNPLLTSLSCSGNQLTELELSPLKNLTTLACDSNNISRLDFSANYHLKKLYCSNNQLEFLDFSNNPGMDYIDCRNNEGISACAINFMISTLLGRYDTPYYPNLLVDGCDWETADMSELGDLKWMSDVTGDGTADCGEVAITVLPAENGTFHLEQSTQYGTDYRPITDKAKVGVPVKVVAVPDEDFAFQSVSINGVAVADTFFLVKEPSEIAVNFRSTLQPYITFNAANGQALTISLAAAEDNTEITIDWGDGKAESYMINSTPHYIDGTASGTTVKITGEVTALDLNSYPGVGWDNQITGLDVSHNDRLVSIETYMNPIKTLSVANCPALELLDCSYCELTELNVTGNPKLTSLACYGNELSELNIGFCPELQTLDAKGNKLASINVSGNSKLTKLNVHDNALTSLDVTALTALEYLGAGMNQLSEIDLTQNTKLIELALSDNKLTALDLTANPLLRRLLCADNQLAVLDLSAQQVMSYIDCSNNALTACAVNDFYFTLPQFEKEESPVPGETFALWVQRSTDEQPNDAEHAEHLIATMRGWTVNQEGDGSGCDEVYVTTRNTENGNVSLHNNGNELPAKGGKVTKGSTVTISTEPAAGYELSSLRANGVDVKATASFTAERFTEVVARFTLKGSGIDSPEHNITLINCEGGLMVAADTEVTISVYTLTGLQLLKQTVSGGEKLELTAGPYIVAVETRNERMTKAVVVY